LKGGRGTGKQGVSQKSCRPWKQVIRTREETQQKKTKVQKVFVIGKHKERTDGKKKVHTTL